MSIKQIQNLSQISDKYDVFFVDLWGVIHDGVEAYPGVQETLISLNNAGKKIIFVSNAPRRAFKAVEGLRKFGIEDGLYHSVITSGEVLYNSLVDRENNNLRYIIIGPERDSGLLDGTSYIRTQKVKDADFIIVTGFDSDDSTIDEKQHYLDEAIKLNLPLICANPDMEIVRISGVRALCAGVIAKKYMDMGGRVIWFGKPYREIYEHAMFIASNPPKNRIAAIGDSLITDIKGANDFGIDSYLIPSGIHANELGIKHGQLPKLDKLEVMTDSYGIRPTGILAEFVF